MKKLNAVIPIIIFLILWEVVVRFNMGNNSLLPPFTEVVKAFYRLVVSGALLKNFSASLFRVLAGFISGSIAGIVIGVIMGSNRLIEKTFHPIFSILLPIPALGWLPVLMLWVGIGNILPVIIIFICSFFPVLYNTITGIKEVNPNYIKVARTLGASKKKILFNIILPIALPSIFTGLRLEAGMAWRVIIAAEMVAIPTGIGAMLMRAESLIRMDIIIVALLILSAMCFIFERFFIYLERRFTQEWKLN